MKALRCEMCESNDLIKQDGYYVCQHCGTKYTVEEAKKLMFDGPVDVSGSVVKVDSSDELANLYQIARRARDDNNSENAAKYYDMILVKDPTSWEASFYVVYFKAMSCKIAQIRSAAISVSNCEDSVLLLIRDHVPEMEQGAAVVEVVLRSIRIAQMLAGGAKSHYDGISADIKNKYTQEYIDNVIAARDILYTCGNQVERIFGEEEAVARCAVHAWKSGIDIHKQILPMLANKSANQNIIASYVDKIGKYDPDYSEKERIKALETEIAGLKTTIAKTSTEPKWNGFGVFVMVCSLILLALPQQLLNEPFYPSITIPAVLCLLLGLWLGVPKKKNQEARCKTVNDAKEALAQKEQELAELNR